MTPEKEAWSGRPSWWNFWLPMATGDLLIALAALLWWTERPRYALWALAAAAPFYLAGLLRRAGVSYAVTTQRVRATTGLISKRVDEVELPDIRNITLTQSVPERLVGIGTVTVSTAADGVEVVLRGICGAEAVKETIRAMRIQASGGSHE